jgi:hypothetical protein
VSLLLAACGGDDAPSREDFASEADRICREAEKELEELGESADSPEEIADAIDEVIEETRRHSCRGVGMSVTAEVEFTAP